MGGNQVMGLNSSVIAEIWGGAMPEGFTYDTCSCQVKFTLLMVSPSACVAPAPQ
jgi:hypothetical protein